LAGNEAGAVAGQKLVGLASGEARDSLPAEELARANGLLVLIAAEEPALAQSLEYFEEQGGGVVMLLQQL